VTLLASILAAVLLAIGALHAYWGFGGVWPGVDGADCARRIAGFRGIKAMPGPGASFSVAALIALAGLMPLVLVHPTGPTLGLLAAVAATGIALVFLGRGIAGFTPAWRRLTPEMPFARYDVRYYSPLCLAIAAGFIVLIYNGLFA